MLATQFSLFYKLQNENVRLFKANLLTKLKKIITQNVQNCLNLQLKNQLFSRPFST